VELDLGRVTQICDTSRCTGIRRSCWHIVSSSLFHRIETRFLHFIRDIADVDQTASPPMHEMLPVGTGYVRWLLDGVVASTYVP